MAEETDQPRTFTNRLELLGVCEELGWVGFLVVCFLHKINPNPRKNIICGRKWPKCHFLPNFSWLGWPWVGEARRFHIAFTRFPTQQNLVFYIINRKHPAPITMVVISPLLREQEQFYTWYCFFSYRDEVLDSEATVLEGGRREIDWVRCWVSGVVPLCRQLIADIYITSYT